MGSDLARNRLESTCALLVMAEPATIPLDNSKCTASGDLCQCHSPTVAAIDRRCQTRLSIGRVKPMPFLF